MARPAKILSFALCSALLVPAMQLAGEAAQTLPERSRWLGRPIGAREPLQAARSGGAARDRVLPKHPVPDGLRGVGDRFLNGSGASDPVARRLKWDLMIGRCEISK
jgi:hypothetical protein